MYNLPDNQGYFKNFGGRFVPEILTSALNELTSAYLKIKKDKSFLNELNYLLKNYAGRPTPLYFAKKLSKKYQAKIYLKREDLLHTGAHKINNTLGQCLLAKLLNKKRVIAETGAGQHGVATATACAMMGLQCVVYMGEEDTIRQSLNVFRMKILGAEVIPVKTGSKTLKDAINSAMRDWVTNVNNTFYCLGSVVGPHPYPMIVRDFQKIIGQEVKSQILKLEKKLPDYLVACVGGGSNSIGLFYPFIENKNVKLIGVEAGGRGEKNGEHSATLNKGRVGILHGAKSYLLCDNDGQIISTHSISAGLDYPGVGPEHSFLKDSCRARYVKVNDKTALQAFFELSKLEGIIPALESSHALAYLKILTQKIKNKKTIIIINLSGRGDKDTETVQKFNEL